MRRVHVLALKGRRRCCRCPEEVEGLVVAVVAGPFGHFLVLGSEAGCRSCQFHAVWQKTAGRQVTYLRYLHPEGYTISAAASCRLIAALRSRLSEYGSVFFPSFVRCSVSRTARCAAVQLDIRTLFSGSGLKNGDALFEALEASEAP